MCAFCRSSSAWGGVSSEQQFYDESFYVQKMAVKAQCRMDGKVGVGETEQVEVILQRNHSTWRTMRNRLRASLRGSKQKQAAERRGADGYSHPTIASCGPGMVSSSLCLLIHLMMLEGDPH